MLNIKNLVTRITSGAVFVLLLIGGIIYNEYSFLVIFSVITILALYEFYKLLSKTEVASASVNKTLNLIGGLLLFISAFLKFSGKIEAPLFFAIYIFYILILFTSELYLKRTNPIISLAYAVLGQIYIALPLSLLSYLAFAYKGNGNYHYALTLALFIFIWVNDSFAYLTGSMLGKHRMFERISPKKSWEGFAGGAIFTVIAAFIYASYHPQLTLSVWIGFALILIVFGTLGDLVESLFKRTLKIKDSGNLIPGHGGLLDRIDSVIFAIPAQFVYLQLLSFFGII